MQAVKTFTFILNPVTTAIDGSCVLIPGHVFRRATAEEGDRIREFLFRGGFSFVKEFAYGQTTEKGCARPQPDSWKYYGIESATNGEIEHLQIAGNLLKTEILLGPSFLWITESDGQMSQGASAHPQKLAVFCSDPLQPAPVHITEQDIVTWRDIVEQVKKLDRNSRHAFRAFESLRTIPRDSPLFGLGLFALIESQITHKPHDQFDSLAHQVSTKMVLLSRRFCRPLPYSEFGCEPPKLWKKLYEYRSCIAHGTTPDFKSGALKVLGNREAIHCFVTEALKLLLLQILTEPQLILDLKEC
jgi:hypothetical protein